MMVRSHRLASKIRPIQAHPLPVSTHGVGAKECSGKKRIRIPRQLKVWALEEQVEKSLSDQKTAELLTKVLIEKNMLRKGRKVSRTAVVAWRKRLKGVTLADAGQSLSFRGRLYKELYEATRRLISTHLEQCKIKLSEVRLTAGDVKCLAENLLTPLMEALEKRIVDAAEKGDLRSADNLRPVLCAYSRCCLSLNWARGVRDEIVGEGNDCAYEGGRGTTFSRLPLPDPTTLRQCALHGLSLLAAANDRQLASPPLRRRSSSLQIKLVRSRIRVEEWELSRLRGEGWLTDSVVYAYCALLEKRNRSRWVRTSVPRMWVMDPIHLCKILEVIRRRGWENFLREIKRKRKYFELLSDTAQAGTPRFTPF
mgnify:CR=1 FL=1